MADIDLTKIAKDAAYITIGFGVIAFQKSQVRRRELEAELKAQRETVKTQVHKIVEQVEARFDELEEKLPEQAKEAVSQARAAAKDAQAQLRTRFVAA